MAVNPDVGKLWDVGLNGVGYRLVHDPDRGDEVRYQRQASVLQDARFVQGDETVRTGVDRYTIHQVLEASGGIGQKFYDRPSSSDTGVLFAYGLDPFSELGVLRSYAETESGVDTTGASDFAAPLSLAIYQFDSDAGGIELWSYTPSTDTASAVAVHGTRTQVDSACADVSNWYISTSGEIWRNGSATWPGAAWATGFGSGGPYGLSFAANRICGWYDSSGLKWTTWDSSGAEEVTGGRITVPGGWQANQSLNSVDTGAYVVTGVSTASSGLEPKSILYSWDKSSSTPFVSMVVPKGVVESDLYFQQGSVYFTSKIDEILYIWRCVVNTDGTLTPFLVYEAKSGATPGGRHQRITGDGLRVYVTEYDASVSGLNKLYAIDSASSALTAIVLSVPTGNWMMFADGALFWHDAASSDVNKLEIVDPSSYRSGEVWYSAVDGGTHEDKVFDEISVSLNPLPANWAVYLDYSTDNGVSFTNAAVTLTDDATSLSSEIGVTARSLIVRVRTLISGGTPSSPAEIVGVQVKYHPVSSSNHDTLIRLPLNVGSDIRMLNNAPAAGNGPGAAKSRLDALEALVGTRLTDFQGPDWVSGAEETVEVQDVRVVDLSLSQQSKARRADIGQIALVTLRKVG